MVSCRFLFSLFSLVDSKPKKKLCDCLEQRSLIQEITQLKIKLAEASKERYEAEVRLRGRESEYNQLAFELSEISATKKALVGQLKTAQDELDLVQLNGVKQESSKKRLLKDLDEARSQLLLAGDERVAALVKQVQDHGKEVTLVSKLFSFFLFHYYFSLSSYPLGKKKKKLASGGGSRKRWRPA